MCAKRRQQHAVKRQHQHMQQTRFFDYSTQAYQQQHMQRCLVVLAVTTHMPATCAASAPNLSPHRSCMHGVHMMPQAAANSILCLSAYLLCCLPPALPACLLPCLPAGKDHSKVLDTHLNTFAEKAKQVSAQVGSTAVASVHAGSVCLALFLHWMQHQLSCRQWRSCVAL